MNCSTNLVHAIGLDAELATETLGAVRLAFVLLQLLLVIPTYSALKMPTKRNKLAVKSKKDRCDHLDSKSWIIYIITTYISHHFLFHNNTKVIAMKRNFD